MIDFSNENETGTKEAEEVQEVQETSTSYVQPDDHSSNMQDFPPSNYLPLSIIATILGCCSTLGLGFVLGIISIVFSTQVKNKWAIGDYMGAKKSAKTAKLLALTAFGFLLINIIYVIVLICSGRYDSLMEQYKSMLNSTH